MFYLKNNTIHIIKYSLLSVCIFLFSQNLFSQKTRIEIINAESLEYDENLGKDVKRLIGNVQFRHENALMFCDSAHFNTTDNTIDAFNHIRVIQGDSLNLKGDHLIYDGNTKIAQIRGDVELTHNKTNLKTHFLDFDRAKNIGYYFNHGVIVDKDNENTLNSNRGFYYAKKYEFFSFDSVTLINKKFSMYSDTLKYNTQNKRSYFFGPTVIRSDSGYIYCENGWYDTNTEISQYNKHAFVVKGNHKLKGDSIYYDRNKSYGKAFNNVELIDTVEKMIIRGNYVYFQEKPEKAFVTDKALFIHLIDTGKFHYDSLYLHADTIRMDVFSPDTFKVIRAFHHVKIFKSDMQAKCDSLTYSQKDSVIRLFKTPVLWSEENQMSADTIRIYSKNNQIDRMVMIHKAFMSSIEDTSKFNQMRGKIITAYVKNNEVQRINIDGNGQSVYYIKDKDDYIGVNKADCSSMIIYRRDKKFDRIMFMSQPDATLFPVDKATKEDVFLKDFVWFDKFRPRVWTDIFH